MSGLLVALLVVAVILGLVGLLVEALWWMIVIGAVLLVLALVRAFLAGRASKDTSRS
jgi:uncharacterized ion transporter superfamily protein YfcC